MRTTLTIDDDVLAAAKHLAVSEKKSVGEMISLLARQGIARRSGGASRAQRNGIPLLALHEGAKPVTLELVNQLRDEQAST